MTDLLLINVPLRLECPSAVTVPTAIRTDSSCRLCVSCARNGKALDEESISCTIAQGLQYERWLTMGNEHVPRGRLQRPYHGTGHSVTRWGRAVPAIDAATLEIKQPRLQRYESTSPHQNCVSSAKLPRNAWKLRRSARACAKT